MPLLAWESEQDWSRSGARRSSAGCVIKQMLSGEAELASGAGERIACRLAPAV